MPRPVTLEMVACPVCGTYSATINRKNVVKTQGKKWQLCSERCMESFCRLHDLEPVKSGSGLSGLLPGIRKMGILHL